MKIKIESGIPMPNGKFSLDGANAELRAAFARMEPGQSFLWPENKQIYRIAAEAGARIKTRKENGSGYRVWLVKRNSNLTDSLTHRLP